MSYLLHVLEFVLIYGAVATSADLVVGRLGLLSFAQAAFFGIGAYTSVLAEMDAGTNFVEGVVVAAGLAAVVAVVLTVATRRLVGDYFVVATLAFQVLFSSVVVNWQSVTGGPLGITKIETPMILGWQVDTTWKHLVLAALLTVGSLGLGVLFTRGGTGRVLSGLKEDELLVMSLGWNPLPFKTLCVAVSAVIAAVAGSLWAHFVLFVDPTSFTTSESIAILSMIIIGGSASRLGPLYGAAAVIVLPEILRYVGVRPEWIGNVRQIGYGAALAVSAALMPRGIVGARGRSRKVTDQDE